MRKLFIWLLDDIFFIIFLTTCTSGHTSVIIEDNIRDINKAQVLED